MCLSSGLSFCQMRRTSCTMDGFCLLYLLMILLVRSGDVETNPGPDRIVSEREFFKLSKQIDPSYYKEVGINFDIPNAELGHIEKESHNTSDALMTVFTRWRDKQPPGTDIRALLAEGLKNSDLGSLSDELLAGSLVPNRTGAPVTRPGSQTQSLSPDLIKRCADDFKFKYRTAFCKIRDDPLDPDSIVPFTDMYTNLVLEEEYRKKRKRPLEYSDLFKLEVNGEFPKRIMVQGEAGAGKTTFCAKIAWDWINDSPAVPKFVWVLVVPFREAKQYTIGEIAKSYLSKDNPATACQITEYIRSNPTHVFIAFDGLDEFKGKVVQEGEAGSKSECHQPKSADQTKARSESKMNKNKQQKSMQPKSSSATLQPRVNSAEASGSSSERGDIALTDILHSDELATCPVLVTSRPWKVTEIRDNDSLRKLYTFIHVEGFSKENVEVYIHKYFPEDTVKADQLIQLTKDNVIISKNMAPFPIYIAMLCLMWKELGDEKQEKLKSLQTFSQIFDEMFEFLKVHYAQKNITDLDSPSFQAYRSRIEKLMEPVAQVAFTGLQENILSFKEGDFEQCSDSIETACRVGVLSQEKKLSSIYDKSNPYLQSTIFFPHKLFQEYMAGAHLASLYELDPNEFNRLIEQVVLPRKEEFRYLLYFTVSRDKTVAHHVMKCMLQGGIQNTVEMDFFVDISFESQDLDTAALLRGRISSLTIQPIMTAHTIAGCIFTGLGVHRDVIDLGVNGVFGPIISHDMGEIICSVPSIKDVTLLRAALHSDFYAVLAKEGNKSKVHTVRLVDVRCPTLASSHYLADALCSMPNLTHLTLRGTEFTKGFYSTLNAKSPTLQDSFPQISNGYFRFNRVPQADFDSFLQSLNDFRRWNYVSDEEDNFSDEEDGVSDEEDGVSDEEDGASDEEDGASDEEDGASDEEDGASDEEDGASDEEGGVSDQEGGVSDQEDGVSDEEENVSDEDDNTTDEEDNVSDEKRLGTGDINLVDRKQSSFEVKPLESEEIQKFLIFTLDQKPILNEFTLPYNDMETTRTTAEAQAAWVSTLSQNDLESDVHYPRRTLPPSDYPQQHVDNTSDTVCEGSSSQSKPCKRKAPSTQSRVPQDDLEIPEKRSKIDLVSDGILDKLSRHMPPGTYTTLCTQLGIEYNEARSILLGFNNNYQMATRDCLAQWKTRTGGNMAQLKAILVDAEVGDLVKYIE
ncbi:uncharacterized protein LOC100888322 isoform X2 [Strongylocentrotus purpuratus]|uniref:NACHT domain-containing protein n=1 Tax=Strongylocentrotus purpuratus TaxID=7668 RepID=A0A7M7NEL1_STRPU|nr:uncharacterized protein LOC100888322 isoform X2 [Strongylocentrotus purpuratus]